MQVTTKWFHRVTTLEELKQQYRKLIVKHHPDLGGRTEDCQEINAEYDAVFRRVSSQHTAMDGSVYEKDTDERPEQFRDLIVAVLRMGLDCEVCGSWVWVGGDTKPHREELRDLGMRWSAKKRMWYFAGSKPKQWGGGWSMERIRGAYGSKVYEGKGDGSIVAA